MENSQGTGLPGPSIFITEDMISTVITNKKTGKAAGPSGILTEMIRSAEKGIISSHYPTS